MSLFVVGLDITIVNVALPQIRADLDAPVSGLQWVLDAYTLVLAALLILSGSVADRIGRRRVLRTGMALFTAGSLLCSVAPSLGWLIAFRVVQAVGGSMLNPVAMSIITNTFTEPAGRARAIGIWGGVAGLSMAAGPLLGGVLVTALGWRSVFWITVPVGVLAMVLITRLVPESRAPRPRRIDPAGQLLVLVLLTALVGGIIEGPGQGWGSPQIVGCFAVAAAALAGLVYHEPRRREPLLDPRFFRSVPFTGASVIAVCAFAAVGGFLFLTTIYLQEVRGWSPLRAGLHTLPMAATTAVFAPIAGRLVATRGTRLPLVLAGSAMAAATVPLTQLTAHTSGVLLVGAFLVFGLGLGMVSAPINTTAVAGLPREQAGVAAAIASTCRQIGSSLGIAVIGAAVASATGGFAGAGRAGWWIVLGCAVAVAVLGLLTTGPRARATAERVNVLSEP